MFRLAQQRNALLAVSSVLLAAILVHAHDGGDGGGTYLWQPAYALDDAFRGPPRPYIPQPGDIYLATDRSKIIQLGHTLATSGAPHHSGIVVARPDGHCAIMEAGPFNTLHIEIVDLEYDLRKHEERGEKVWIRRRCVPLTDEQSTELTAWACGQNGKRFAARRMLRQLTPIRARGPLRTYYLGGPHGERSCYFCSELVLESCVHVGLLDPAHTRPTSTFPRDLFFDQSPNIFVNTHFKLAPDWEPPARWTSQIEAGNTD
jgi:hypothetical protein